MHSVPLNKWSQNIRHMSTASLRWWPYLEPASIQQWPGGGAAVSTSLQYTITLNCNLCSNCFTQLIKSKSIRKSVWAYVSKLSYKIHTAEKLICTSEFGPCPKSRIYDLYTATDHWVEINMFWLHFMEAPLLSNFIHSQLVFYLPPFDLS